MGEMERETENNFILMVITNSQGEICKERSCWPSKISSPQKQLQVDLSPWSSPSLILTAISNTLPEKRHPLIDMGAVRKEKKPIPEAEFNLMILIGARRPWRFNTCA